MRRGCLVALGLLCAASPSAAQTYDTSYVLVPPSRCAIPDSEMTRVPVYAWVDLPDSGTAVFRAAAENLLQDVALHLGPLLGAAPNLLPHGEPAVRWFDLDTPLAVTAHRDGRIAWRPASSHDTAAASLLGRALARAIADGSAILWDSTMMGDSVRFRLELSSPRVEGVGLVKPLEVKHAAIPVFSIAMPPTTSVAPWPGNRAPPYPEGARVLGVQGAVLMQFVVDTTGRAVVRTAHPVWPDGTPQRLRDLRSGYATFVDAVLRALPDMRFHPATVDGVCRVDEWVQQPFVFRLGQ